MNLFHLLDGQTALVLSVLTGTLIPFLSALATKAPSFLTGVITSLLAAASGFLAEWAGNSGHYDWKAGASTALLAWLVALGTHISILRGTPLQAQLHAVGSKKTPAPAA